MRSLRRPALLLAAVALLTGIAVLAWPDPPPARANVGCEVASAPAGAVTEAAGAITGGAIGGGNPVGDACNSVTDGAVEAVTSPVTGALKGIGNSIFSQITTWVTEGATWLIGQVVNEIEKSTTPELSSAGFLSEYARMAQIAAALAAASALLAILEALAQSSWALLARAFLVNLPLAFLATSVAFVVVQLLLVATDGMSHAIAAATQEHSRHFFHTAIGDLSKAGGVAGGAVEGGAGTKAGLKGAGEVAVPVFVTFLVAIIGAFAAFFVWVELLMRDAAVYVVALFLPLAFAASIWPRWSGALRRTGELLVVVIGSKFVIVSIIALAAGLVSEEGADVEHILAASALMLLACFAPFMLFRLVPFAEGAMAAAYGRRSAGAVGGPMMVSSGAQMIRGRARSNWAEPEVWSVTSGGGGGDGKPGPGGGDGPQGTGGPGGPTPRPGGPGGAGGGGAEGASGAAGAGGPAGAGAAAPLAAAPVAAARAAQGGAGRLADTGVAREAASGGGGAEDPGGASPPPSRDPAPRPARPPAGQADSEAESPPPPPAEAPRRPPQEQPARPRPEGSR